MPAATSSPSPSICGPRRATTRSSAGCTPEEFVEFAQYAEGLGFAGVLAGPLVRSSYRAGRLYEQAARTGRGASAPRSARTYVSLVTMAKPRTAAENKAARAEATGRRARPPRESVALSCGRRSTIQRKEDKRLLPYMIGAFVLIAGVSVGGRVCCAGGFTMIIMIAARRGAGRAGRVHHLQPPRPAQSIYRKAEGQTGAAAWVLDNLRGKWRVTPGVAATGHFDAVHRVTRPARRHPGRRGIGGPGQTAAGPGEKAHRAAGRRRADLRRHRRQRRGRGSAGQAGAPPHPSSGQHHRQADGHAGVAVGRAGIAGRCRASCPRGRCRTPARCAASSAPCAASSAAGALSAAPPRCRSADPATRARRQSVNNGGTTNPISSPRTTDRPMPIGSRPSTAAT